jgi:Ca-activated chloride channel homolog
MRSAVSAGGGALIIFMSPLSLFFQLAALGASFQVAEGPVSDTISVDVDLVVLHATVRDKNGGFVSGLRKENFRVFENGALQDIRVFQAEDVPVAVGLVVDNSGSMGRKRKEVTAAALAFAKSSNPQDEMFVLNFNEQTSFGLPDTELFSASAAELAHALNGVPARGKTALYDAIEMGLGHLKKAKLEKKVLIVISDGGDNASHRALNQVLDNAGRSDAIIYTVGLFDEYDHDRNPGVLKKIARATGGEAFLPVEMRDVVPVCERIAQDIRNQYTIGYVPSNPKLDRTYRTITVTAKGSHGEKYLVRTRAGYIASPDRQVRPANLKEQLQ